MSRLFARAFACACVVLAVTVQLHASCGSSSCPIDLHSLQAPERGFSLDLSFQYIDQDQPRIGSRKAAVGEIASDHDEVRTINRLTALQLGARISDRVQLLLSAPFVSRSHEHIDAATGDADQWRFSDPGDLLVQGRYRAWSSGGPRGQALWLTGGVKLPTGSTHVTSIGGEGAEVTITPGTGSTDAIVGATWQSGWLRDTALAGPMGGTTRIPWFVGATMRFNGRGTEDYRRGRELQVNAGGEYPLSSRLNVLGQLNARSTARDDVGRTDEDRDLTGGRYLYVSPGLRLMTGRALSLYALVQIPMYQHVNGIQLTSGANYVAGVHWAR